MSPVGSPKNHSNLIELDKSNISEGRGRATEVTRYTERGRKTLPFNDTGKDEPIKRTSSLSRSLFGGLMTSTHDKSKPNKKRRRDSVNSKFYHNSCLTLFIHSL